MPIVMKSGSLKLLEPAGPVQACNGIASPFTGRRCLSDMNECNVKTTFYVYPPVRYR